MDTLNTLKPFSAAPHSQGRAIGIGFVALLHVALVYALLNMGIVNYFIAPPKGPLTFVNLPPTHTSEPIPQPRTVGRIVPEVPPIAEPPIDYAPIDLPPGPPGNGPGQSLPYSSGPSGIMSTHTIPPYPPIEIRLGDQGTVSLRVMIDESGFVTEAVIARSSGFPRLDQAAVSWVKAHWRYRPAVRNGVPVAATTDALVKFEIH